MSSIAEQHRRLDEHEAKLANLERALSMKATDGTRRWLHANGYLSDFDSGEKKIKAAAYKALADGRLDDATYQTLQKDDQMVGTKATPERVFGGDTIRVKAPSEAYSTKRPCAQHPKLGREVFDETGAEVTRPSQMSLAKNGAFLKWTARRAGLPVEWTEHDAALFREICEKDSWASFAGPEHENRIYAPGSIKALIDDSTSGGLEAVPISFDDDVITFPLLGNELLPLVDLKPVARGRRIEGVSMLTPTVSWGGGDDNNGTLFSTASMVAPLDTTIFTVDCFVEVGRDFLSDTPLNAGQILTQLIGERLAAELDSVIADGNGTTQPQGVMQASGTTSVSFSGTTVTVTKLLSLLFGVGKAYRAPAGNNFAFVSNETGYQRARSVATGVTGDTRLVLGMDVESYSALQRPWRIANTLSNAEHFAGAMKKYRLYRRLGMSVEWHTSGKELARRNIVLLAVRARYGGRVVDPSGFATVTNAEA